MTPNDIHLLLTGDELMSGDTVDSNSSMIAQSLAAFGHGVAEKVTLGDDRARLVAALQRAEGKARILIMNGGLGPTQDDLTASWWRRQPASNCTAPEADKHVRDWCAARSIEPNDANLKQAWLPEGAAIIHNPRGSAVGFAMDVGGTLILTTPACPGNCAPCCPRCVSELLPPLVAGRATG